MTVRTFASTAAIAFALGFAPVTGAFADEAAMATAAKVSIVQAIEAAEAKGGKATEADFEDDNGGRWEIKVVSDGGNKLTEFYVDPNSGQVTGQEEQTFEKYFSRLTPENFAKAQVQLKDAIAAAEKLASGKAYSAEVEREGETVAYEVDVLGADGKKDVKVDAAGKAVLD